MIKVWDPFVRIFHWSLVLTFAIAFITADEWDDVHEIAGYVIAGLVAFRIVWGLIGSRRARFASFAYHPRVVVNFIRQSLQMKAPRYLGHNPAGGLMVLALLAMLAVITATGIAMESNSFFGYEWVEDLHEIAANLTLGLIALHIAGVILASMEHGENLVRAMINGRKRSGDAVDE